VRLQHTILLHVAHVCCILELPSMQAWSLEHAWTNAEEYMKDTEDYINIELDSSQNRLFRLDIVLTAAAFSMEIFHVMGGKVAVAHVCDRP
jgi:hypothetical protein